MMCKLRVPLDHEYETGMDVRLVDAWTVEDALGAGGVPCLSWQWWAIYLNGEDVRHQDCLETVIDIMPVSHTIRSAPRYLE